MATESTSAGKVPSPPVPLPRPMVLWASELAATALMLLAVTVLFRHLFHPDAWLYAQLASADARLLVDAAVSGAVVAVLVASPFGRVSGAHMNPAVTVALWVVRHVPTRHVPLYVSAQLLGSVIGAFVGRHMAGAAVAHPVVDYALLRPAGQVSGVPVAVGEAVATGVLLAVVIRLVRRPALAEVTPVTIGALLTVLIAVTAGPTGGSLSPARQLGPWMMAGADGSLWPYVVGPLGAALAVGAVAAALPEPTDGDRSRW